MRKHILIFVHGMGVYVKENTGKPDNTWGKDSAKALKEQYEKYPSLVTPFDDLFEPVYINYDVVFHDILRRWAEEERTISAQGIEAAEVATRMVRWLNGVDQTDDNFAWTHVGDVILYRFFNLVRQRVKITVAKQIHEALEPNSEGGVTRWSIIAHSLGTAVTHDVVHAMNSTTPNEAGIPILDTMAPRANLIAMIANESKCLENNADVYESVVVPPTSCDVYLSANNKFDPFVSEKLQVPERFNPAGHALWDTAFRKNKFINIETENIHEVNVHSIRNYLVNPHVHIPLLRALCGPGSIPESLAQAARDNFKNIPHPNKQEMLNKLRETAMEQSWFDAIAKLLPQMENPND